MRIRTFVGVSALTAVFALPAVVYGQFQQPTSEELKMTTDAKYPDAAAVILNLEEKTDDTLHYRSMYMRVKILKESAKDLATVSVGYLATVNVGYVQGNFTVDSVSARTIHADGTIIPLNMKPADLMRAKQGETEIRQVTFNLPSVEVGSILEYYYQVRNSENLHSQPYWEIQGRFPVREAKYSFTPYPDMLSGEAGRGVINIRFMIDEHGQSLSDLLEYVHLPPGKTLAANASKRFELELSDIPPLPRERWTPPIESQRYEVRFYYAPGSSVGPYWTSQASFWLKDVDRFAQVTGPIKEAAASLVAPGDSEIDKAKKLYAAVQGLENTDFTRKKGENELKQEGLKAAKRAEDTWTQKSGSGEDLALLYLALLRAA